jgi:hypothetical protein
MSVSVIRQRFWKPPRPFLEKLLQKLKEEIDGAWKSPLPLRWRLLLRAGGGIAIIIWLVTVAWVVPVG